MAIDFPDSPSVNDTYTVGGATWIWTGSVWQRTDATVGPTGPKGDTGPSEPLIQAMLYR